MKVSFPFWRLLKKKVWQDNNKFNKFKFNFVLFMSIKFLSWKIMPEVCLSGLGPTIRKIMQKFIETVKRKRGIVLVEKPETLLKFNTL